MSNRWKIVSAVIIVVVVMAGIIFGMGELFGERVLPLQIENQTGAAVTIYVQGNEVGTIEPNTSVTINSISGTLPYYLIKAENQSGETIYADNLTIDQLQDKHWTVVIGR